MHIKISIISSLIIVGLVMSCEDDEILSVIPPASDTCFVVDQANYEENGRISIAFLGGSVGQEFRPTRSSIDEVRLKFNDWNIDTGTVFVRLRKSLISGEILGTSEEHYLELSQNLGDFDLKFRFPNTIEIHPEWLYVFEVVADDGFKLLITTGDWTDYTRGRAIYPDGPTEATDLYFELGEYVDCEPDTIRGI